MLWQRRRYPQGRNGGYVPVWRPGAGLAENTSTIEGKAHIHAGVPWLVAGVGNVGESPTQRWLSCIFLQTTLCLFRLALAGLEQPSGRDGKWTLG
jgi:hypothetical protein